MKAGNVSIWTGRTIKPARKWTGGARHPKHEVFTSDHKVFSKVSVIPA